MVHESKALMLHLSPAAGETFYDQIIRGIKKEISEERIKPGDLLPSFRQLAADLLVSVITVKRAYEELEREGIIYRRQGVGTFVSDKGLDRTLKAKRQRARDLLAEAIREAKEAGLSEEEIKEMTQKLISKKGAEA